jgi:hypothetical protein
MKIEYEVCDVCREKLPNNSLKRKLRRLHTAIALQIYETDFWGARFTADERELLLCGKCWDSFMATWQKFRKEQDARK